MINAPSFNGQWATAPAKQRRASLQQYVWVATWTLLSLGLGLLLMQTGPHWQFIALLFSLFAAIVSVCAIFYRPRYGIYLILFFTLMGDAALLPSYPFVKNFSSPESLLYVNGALIFSPLEMYMALVTFAWLWKGAMQRKLDFYLGALFWPALVFVVFLIFGLIYGLGTGGDANIALWEMRPIFYLPLMLFLTSNLIQKREQIHRLLWFIMAALCIEGLIGSRYFFVVLQSSLAGVDRITEHSAAIHMNTLLVFVLAAWLFGASITKRLVLPLMVPAVLITYLATQRRAAFVTLAVALFLMTILLFKENRRLFFLIVPVAALVGILYLGAFWNSGSAMALPAQAIKSIVAPEAGSEDELSNIYRVIENLNVSFTFHKAPLTGVGFGNKFYIVVPMADISFFDWWEYIVHNSVFWIWLKTGVLGFLSMLFLVGFSIVTGVRVLQRMPTGDLKAVALTATLYVIMHFAYAYVDMSWDVQSMVYLGAMLGLVNCLEHVVAKPVAVPSKRWPWQPESEPAPGLIPLPGQEWTDE